MRSLRSDTIGDHLAATIYVPNGLKIEPTQMKDIVYRTTRIVSNSEVSTEDVAELHEIFAKEYEFDSEAPLTVASEGHDFAVAYYGGDNGRELGDFFGDKLYQPDFLKYAGVLLVDENLGVTADGMDDVSDLPLAETVEILPPEPRQDGFTPFIYHSQFDQPFLVPLGGKVKIVWKRTGFEDIEQMIEITEPDMQPQAIITGDSRKSISPASFYITSQVSKAQVNNAQITVNGVEITEPVTMTLTELRTADVVIRATGYFTFRSKLDLASTTQALIQLQEQVKIYRFELPKKNSELGSPIRFEIHTKRDIPDSPIEGYTLLDDIREGSTHVNHLEYTGSSAGISYRNAIIGAIAAIIVGFLLGWAIMGSGSSKSGDTQSDSIEAIETVPATEPTAATKPATADKKAATAEAKPTGAAASAAAISYLDKNSKWTREELEKFSELKGLFDDLNNFRLQRITEYWAPRLSASSNFTKKIATAASQSLQKGIFKPQSGETYCKPGDTSITVVPYTYRIDPAKKSN
jgi:hypothetical protein